ncbi:MAG: FAD-dependent oxidoreductase [Oscillospiraceae bacterium]|nr:FAD-dependent oxidoreductase [Oscillospiraceae bacterium]MDY3064810.1 FAD-dependent oxidoreductase [Oscillospiraceae bacterium]
MECYKEPAKEIPVYGRYDVIVAGGGCAGFAAAVAAARTGAKTLIIEQFPFFGGTATASLMATIVGVRNQVKPDELQVCKGIGEELILNMIAEGGAEHSRNSYESEKRSDTKGDLSYNYAFDTEIFKKVTLDMAVEAGCDILFHTYFADTIMEEDCVKGIIVENKSGRQAIFARVVIDATGDGDVAARAGAAFWQTKRDEAPRLVDAIMYKISGFDPDTDFPGGLFGNELVLWGPATDGRDATDAKELTDMEIATRRAVFDHLENLKKERPDLKNARVADTGVLLGIRQTRFVKGVYTLTGDDVLEGAAFPDSIAMGANPVIHYFGYRRFLTHEGYEIPYRCLVPEKTDGLLVAGRCMSSDQIAYESWRAMAHILNIGEAAGTAAALSARTDVQPRKLDVSLLQKALIENGAEIGQGRTTPSAAVRSYTE